MENELRGKCVRGGRAEVAGEDWCFSSTAGALRQRRLGSCETVCQLGLRHALGRASGACHPEEGTCQLEIRNVPTGEKGRATPKERRTAGGSIFDAVVFGHAANDLGHMLAG
jgi:hypothetical protein